MNKEYRDEFWYPKIHSNPYIWKGELQAEELRNIQLRVFMLAANGIPSTAFSTVKAFLDGNKELRQLVNWWQFDEETHEEMLSYVLTSHFGFSHRQLADIANKQLSELKSQKIKDIDKVEIRAVNKFQALRDGPAILVGALMLLERENTWTNQNSARAYREHYHLSNDALVFTNVHTYIDLFHSNLGKYVIGKYARNKEEQELVKILYQTQMLKQMEASKTFYSKLVDGKLPSVMDVTIDGNVG